VSGSTLGIGSLGVAKVDVCIEFCPAVPNLSLTEWLFGECESV